jgi:microcystin degradation protein MlrC
MRMFAASLATETNTFAPMPTSLEDFKEAFYAPPGQHPDKPQLCTAPLWVARRRAREEGFELVEGSSAWAEPSGTVARSAYETLRDEILDQLKAAMPVDGVLLGLHGAMVAHGYEDVEGDIAERARAIVGKNCVIGVELDPHCHMTLKRMRASDVIVCYKEYPHTDVVERAEDVLDLVLRTLKGEIRPVMSLYDCRQIQMYPTTEPVMRSFVDRIKAMEGKDGVLSISIVHCFPYADVPENASRVLVIADGDKAKADRLATSIGEELVSLRGKTMPQFLDVREGVAAAVASNVSPVVLADPADNAGGGAPSDNTTILRHLIEQAVDGAAVGPIWDPIAVRLCFDAGEGATLPLRFGGKIGPASGTPIDADVTVAALARDCWQSFGPTKVPLGDCAAVRIGGIEAVLIANRTQALGLELFTNVGIDPCQRRIVVVKSSNHFMAAFGPIAKRVIYVDSDAPLARDYRRIAYTRVQRPIWPLDADTKPGLIF